MANLSYVNIFCKDIIKLSNFYIKTFNFKEIKEIRSPIFRGVDTGKSAIGFNAMAVYNLLDIKKFSKTTGAKFLLNFDARSMNEVDVLTQKAKKNGGKIIKSPYRTYYHWYQSVIIDPEKNIFRINKVLPAKDRSQAPK